MHPPPYRPEQKLSDWSECFVEVHCRGCDRGGTVLPVKLLITRYRDCTFSSLLRKLRCKKCKQPPAPAYLCASHHRVGGHGGPRPDWAIEIIAPPAEATLSVTRAK